MIVVDAGDERALAPLYAGGWDAPREVRESVGAILDDVRARGDAAVVELTRRFDDPQATLASLRRDVPARKNARGLVPETIAAGLELARERIIDYHARQKPADIRYHTPDLSEYAFLSRPLHSIGAYVPGGSASLPSTVLMTVMPAKVAGVERVVVATPPQRDGSSTRRSLRVQFVRRRRTLRAGGAQAIAAWPSARAIAPVGKIVGGNVYVTEAERQVFGVRNRRSGGSVGGRRVRRAGAGVRAGELIAQATRSVGARCRGFARRACSRSRRGGAFARETGRGEIVERVLAERTWLIHAASDEQIFEVIERFAPEHLSLQVADPWSLVPHVRHAGAIFIGDHTPVAAGDYIAGTNHTLPTSGASRFASGLRTADYYRTMSVVENSAARMAADAETLAALADFEGLPAHARTARMRIERP